MPPQTQFFLCAQCREALKDNLTLRELSSPGEKRPCDFCRRECYGGVYSADYTRKDDSNARNKV